ncbi:hypothetical protein [Ancylobacter mangrovi]|uniref:hypothetical protein n=1 Tax=Ancylobacter mangrovi TaxID=2972472 RepID=UPI002161898B|nr:hypothetical protein [Ancylobacter mangrovi]MCS0502740.1 hypothetical protein [Ancylobacter mangrovi]
MTEDSEPQVPPHAQPPQGQTAEGQPSYGQSPQAPDYPPAPREAAARPASAAPRPAAAGARSKGPPQDPEAFHRWIEIERLKVEMRRLELETRRSEAPASAPPSRTGGRVLPIAVAAGFVAMLLLLVAAVIQIGLLRGELGTLRDAQAGLEQRLDDRLAAMVETRLAALGPSLQSAAPTAQSAPAPTATAPQPAASDAAAPSPADMAATPAPDGDSQAPATQTAPTQTAAAAPTTPDPPAKPALLGTGYVVRMFAPTGSVPAARVNAFTSILKNAGFEVVVSDSGVVQPTANTLSYHASAAGVAEKLATLVQSKRPALDLELRTSTAIREDAKQVLILNVTEGALN